MEDSNGDKLYRSWNFYNPSLGREIYQKYPSDWTAYFSRCEIYLRTPLGKFSHFISTVDQLFTFPLKNFSFLDFWYREGYLKARAVIRIAINVRECAWLIIKLTKFYSSFLYCPRCPVNFLRCPIENIDQ